MSRTKTKLSAVQSGLTAVMDIASEFRKRKLFRAKWFQPKKATSTAGPAEHEHADHPGTIAGPPYSHDSRGRSYPDDVDLEELRRSDPEGFRRHWAALERRVEAVEGSVGLNFDHLRTTGRPSAVYSHDRTDSGVSSVDETLQPSAKWKGKAKVSEIDPYDRLYLGSLQAIKKQTFELNNKHGEEHTHDSGSMPGTSRAPAFEAVTRDCVVCTNELSVLEFPIKSATSACNHSIQACKGCLSSWLASELADKGHVSLTCPECSKALTYEDVQRAASRKTFAMYDRLTAQAALAELPGFAWCLAPRCGNGQLNERQSYDNFMRCAACKYSQCVHHCVAWHWHETCEEYDYRVRGQKATDDEAKTQAMLDDVSKLCPGPGCKWRLQKNAGCDQ